MQSEASFFSVPCLICRENTERPIYLEQGTSILVGRNKKLVKELLAEIEQGAYRQSGPLVKELGTNVARKTTKIIADYLRVIIRGQRHVNLTREPCSAWEDRPRCKGTGEGSSARTPAARGLL